MTTELITVIVPVYQAQRHLDRCIRSILGQSYKNLEIILVDDGSTDRSGEICDGYGAADERVRVVHKENGGVSSARNAGLRLMTGTYFMTVDADDYLTPDAVTAMRKSMLDNDADLVISGFQRVYEDHRTPECYVPSPFSGDRESFVNEKMTEYYDKLLLNNQNNKLYSSRIVTEQGVRYDESMSINEDAWFSMTMLRHSRRIASVCQAFLCYQQYDRPGSLVSRFYENGVDTCFVLLRSVNGCLDSVTTDSGVRNQMYNRMIFHICGFAGLNYSRSTYSLKRCRQEIRRLAGREDFRSLLLYTEPRGVKNKIAVFLLGGGHTGWYHLLCVLLYARKRHSFKRGNKTEEKDK